MAAKLLGIQIIGILFGFFMMYYTFLYYKRKEFTIKEYGFWLILWASFIILALFPGILDPLLKSIGIIRAMDFFVIAGFMLIIGMVFYTYTLVRKNQKKLEEMVRNIAMKRK